MLCVRNAPDLGAAIRRYVTAAGDACGICQPHLRTRALMQLWSCHRSFLDCILSPLSPLRDEPQLRIGAVAGPQLGGAAGLGGVGEAPR